MPLNFHGHHLAGNSKKLFTPLSASRYGETDKAPLWSDTILEELSLSFELSRFIYYRMTMYPDDDIGSAESIVLRTGIWKCIEALYRNWEIVVGKLTKEVTENGVLELEQMVEISYQYPVMVWEFYSETNGCAYVESKLRKLPSSDSINELYDLPHMQAMYMYIHQNDFFGNDDREAQKACRRALAERNKRLNAAAKTQSPRQRKGKS